MAEERIVSAENEDFAETSIEKTLRPQVLAQYIGQDRVKNELAVYIEAAKSGKSRWTMCYYMARLV